MPTYKWIEVSNVNSVTIYSIQNLRSMFAAHGLPRTVVSDNGSVFTSSEFQTKNGIHHIRSALYHLVSNNLAERVIQTLKKGFKNLSNRCLETKIFYFLFQYWTTPYIMRTTGQSLSAQLLLSRHLLDQLHPDITTHVEHKQKLQKQKYDQHMPRYASLFLMKPYLYIILPEERPFGLQE